MMSERFTPKSLKKQDAIEQEISDWGLISANDYKEAQEIEFEKLFDFVNADKVINFEQIEQYKKIEDSLERLNTLAEMDVRTAVEAIRLSPIHNEKNAYQYLDRRLTYYSDLIDGRATRLRVEQVWDSANQRNTEVVHYEPIDQSTVYAFSVEWGLIRDIFYAAMIGTPELAIYKITNSVSKKRGVNTTHVLPVLKALNYETPLQYSKVLPMYASCTPP